jgi:hypothetical protein
MYTLDNLQLIEHVFPGNLSLFELQACSHIDSRWYAIHTENNLEKIKDFCNRYNYPLPVVKVCNNH